MQDADIPVKFPIPFANSAGGSFIRAIPTASQIGIQAGAASLTDGFPPVNFNPVATGGTPPWGADMNGLMKQVTEWCQWVAAGGPVFYDATYSTAIGGYPKGALLASTTNVGRYWLSTVEDNVTNPETGGAGWTLTPGGFPLATGAISVNTTLTNLSSGTYYNITGTTPIITLPAVGTTTGLAWGFYATVPATISTAGGAVFRGGILTGTTSVAITTGQWVCVQSNGVQWVVFSASPDVLGYGPTSFPFAAATIGGTTTIAAAAHGTYYRVTGASAVVTLPSASVAITYPFGFYAEVACTITAAGGAVFKGGTQTGATSIALAVGQWLCVQSDGTNWVIFSAHPDVVMISTGTGRLLNVRTLTGSGVYTPTAGTGRIEILVLGGGGGGAGSPSATSSQSSSGTGGGAGSTTLGYLTTGFAGVSYSVGAGGAAGAAGATPGVAGGDTTFGALTALGGPGGVAGFAATGNTMPFISAASPVGPGSGGYLNLPGNGADSGHVWGYGGNSYFGGRGLITEPGMTVGGPGGAGRAPGAGGAGGHHPMIGVGPAYAGGVGAAGTIIIHEYT